ncbi:DNA topoisomerase-3 [Promicromonospora sp. AC04]|uniref:DNA topoisomerase n=1 Tax=Promicromonospora sp. AC04 TaxID=2135723 RepID=UPI000D34BA41|nr:DNA topoisomerase [Promicromonospora sp. AC04]PUB32556.1 DNA topoisomerase-3 [Promicromonospora sp. AC04]
MTIGILTEKPSAARHFAQALGGTSGTYKGQQFVIAHARGHLYEFTSPHRMVGTPALAERYEKWDLVNLPWDPDDLDWRLEIIKGTKQVAQEVKRTLAGCDEIVVATDVDPTGEGGMIAVNTFLELGLRPRAWSRMYFTDETPASVQKAFVARKPIASLLDFDEYRKARYRAQFDLLSMQFTRVATNMARMSGQDLVLRQGRLKSAMVKLVGDQLAAYNDYVRKPFFQNRFRDENGVVYTDPEEPRCDRSDQVQARYMTSPVVLDGTADKRTAPPRLLDLASLSSVLVGQGVKAKLTLSTYQKMYEDQVVSYPRTEDKTITPEQFDQLAPLVDTIAAVVNVDPALLTHRRPRSTHVKPKGAHGANRPGPKVPGSLDEVEHRYGAAGRLIYETLAKNYLAMLAEDYLYEQQKGHVRDYPAFVGISNVPKSLGWKAVFDPDTGDRTVDGEDDEADMGLGRVADPFVFEGANKRPEHPSMKWLMKQLEKRDVGTGATRTSTYSEVTNDLAKYPLLTEKGKRVTLARAGELSWQLLPGTRIGDLGLTEKVYQDMREIAEGKTTAEDCLRDVADWVREDIATMRRNAAAMRTRLGLKETPLSAHAVGVWQKAPDGPARTTFKTTWSGHEFSDDEVTRLLRGETISFVAQTRAGRTYTATGALARQTYKGRDFVGFQLEVPDAPTTWSGRAFTPGEVTALLAGKALAIDDFVSSKTGNTFGCTVRWDEGTKKIVPDFGSGDAPPRSWCRHTFTDSEKKKLADGERIFVKGFISRAGKTFDAEISWQEESGKKKIVPSFG